MELGKRIIKSFKNVLLLETFKELKWLINILLMINQNNSSFSSLCAAYYSLMISAFFSSSILIPLS